MGSIEIIGKCGGYKMNSVISILETDGNISSTSYSYSLSSKKALICFIMQEVKKNFNTWTYPEDMKGIIELPSKRGFSFELFNGNVITAYDQPS